MSNAANFITSETESVKLPPVFAKKALTALQLKKPNFRRGRDGEKLAALYLHQKGYQVLGLNTKIARFEIDIIAFDKTRQELVFVEVKNRKSSRCGHPSLAVNSRKLYKLTAAAEIFISRHHLKLDYRFDIIAVIGKRVEHLENISWNF